MPNATPLLPLPPQPVTRRRLFAESAVLAAGVGVAPLVAACGQGGGAAAPAAGGPAGITGTLTLALSGGEQQHPAAILDGFRARHPKLQVETFGGNWGETLKKVASMVAAGTPPDVWYGEDGRATGWGPQGWIRDLAPYLKRDLKAGDYYQLKVTEDAQHHIWAVPGDLQVVALFYNTNAFTEVGLAAPTPKWTLDDLTEAARRLTDPAKKQFGFYPQPNYITTSWYLFPKLFGTGVLDDTGTRSQFDHPTVRRAYEALLDFAEKGLAPPYAEQGKYRFAPTANSEGRSAMQFHIYARLADTNMQDFPFDVELVPSGPGGRWTTVIANSWVIGKTSPVPDAGWAWITWHSQTEQQVTRARAGTGVPMNKKAAEQVVAEAPPPPKNRRAFLRSLDFAGPLGLNAVWQEWRTVAQTELIKAFKGEVSLPNALQEAHRLVQAELDAFYKK